MKLIVNCSQPMPSLQSSGHVPEPKSWLMHRVLKIKPYVVSIFKKCRTKKPTVASHIWKERTVKNTSKVISALGGTSLLWQLSAKYKAQKSWVLGRRLFFFLKCWIYKKGKEPLQSSWGAMNTGDTSDEGVTIVPVLKYVSPFWSEAHSLVSEKNNYF